jgi:hypothetical protein
MHVLYHSKKYLECKRKTVFLLVFKDGTVLKVTATFACTIGTDLKVCFFR